MTASKIEEVLGNIKSSATTLRAWKKVDPETIQRYETANGVILPDDYKTFLEHSNGLDKIIFTEDVKGLWQQGDYEEADSPGNKILSIEEVFNEYEDLTLKDWKLFTDYKGPYPYIPFCISRDGEILVFVNQMLSKEPAIFYAYHDEPASAWFAVANNFTEFLDHFIKSNGDIPTDEVGKNLCAEDYLKTLDFDLLKKKVEDPTEVVKRTSAYIELFPDDSLSYNSRANAYTDSQQYELALNDFNKSLELDPKSAFYYYCRGSMFLKIKKARQALIDFDSACKLEPDSPFYLSSRAESFYVLHKLKKALDDCNRVIEIDDTYELAYMTRYNIYLAHGEDDLAKADSNMLDKLLADDD